MRSTLVSTLRSVTFTPGITASLGSVTTPLMAEEEFWQNTFVGVRPAALANTRHTIRPHPAQLALLRFMICILIASGMGKAEERSRVGRSSSCAFRGVLERMREWYKLPPNPVTTFFHSS